MVMSDPVSTCNSKCLPLMRIAVLILMFIERTVSMEVKIATKSALRFIIIRIRVLCLRLRRQVIFGQSVSFRLLDLTCPSFIAFNHIQVGNEAPKFIVFIHQMM
ncbi:unnamed protein product [Hymenolepis diminuta]|uniref:Uncharacterized protein n=1 Tax=Hymenolepis diminuta TaxID=6216 RepID=A0A564Z7D3_HYMDI|nr:unnamed protein product [Hymenolepis diminuta]